MISIQYENDNKKSSYAPIIRRVFQIHLFVLSTIQNVGRSVTNQYHNATKVHFYYFSYSKIGVLILA